MGRHQARVSQMLVQVGPRLPSWSPGVWGSRTHSTMQLQHCCALCRLHPRFFVRGFMFILTRLPSMDARHLI